MNPYLTLHIAEDATDEEVKKAYRKLSKEHHPDVGGNEEDFQTINLAYRVLSDHAKRKLYDEQGVIMDESPNHIENLVNARLADIAEKWLDNMLRGTQIPLTDFAVSGMMEATRKIGSANQDLQRMVERAEDVLNRLSCSNKSSVIHSTIKNRIATYKRGIEQNKTEIIILGQLKEVIDSYDYEKEVEEMILNSTSSTSSFTVTGFGGMKWDVGS